MHLDTGGQGQRYRPGAELAGFHYHGGDAGAGAFGHLGALVFDGQHGAAEQCQEEDGDQELLFHLVSNASMYPASAVPASTWAADQA